jgi:polar amino acid transport system permease protein
MLGSSVVSVISATDLTAAGNDLNSITFASFEIYSILTLMYLFMTLVFSVFFTAVGRKVFAYPVSR